jgi:hypothetical protein
LALRQAEIWGTVQYGDVIPGGFRAGAASVRIEPRSGSLSAAASQSYDAATPDDPFYTATIGGLSPNDANDPGGDIVSGTGFYAGSLPVGGIVRNDVPDGYGRPTPSFALPLLSIEADQIFELSIVLAPEVWFETVKVPQSD